MKTLNYDFQAIPFDDIVKFGHVELLHRDLFVVSWILGRYCNYSCSYCWVHGSSRKKDHRPTELYFKTIDEIKRQARGNGFNSFSFSLSGGEPTFHPGFLDILKYLADDTPNTNRTSVHMTSNCSQNMKWFEQYVSVASRLSNAMVTASFHGEHLDTQDKIANFADKLLFIQSNKIYLTINMVMVPENFYNLYEKAQYFHGRGLNVTLKPQSDPHANYVVDGYSKEMLDIMQTGMPKLDRQFNTQKDVMNIEFEDSKGNLWYMDEAERFNAFGFNRFKGWNCNAGYQSIIIQEPSGNVKRSYSCIDKPIGNIATGFEIFKTANMCISPACVSSADSKIPKSLL